MNALPKLQVTTNSVNRKIGRSANLIANAVHGRLASSLHLPWSRVVPPRVQVSLPSGIRVISSRVPALSMRMRVVLASVVWVMEVTEGLVPLGWGSRMAAKWAEGARRVIITGGMRSRMDVLGASAVRISVAGEAARVRRVVRSGEGKSIWMGASVVPCLMFLRNSEPG